MTHYERIRNQSRSLIERADHIDRMACLRREWNKFPDYIMQLYHNNERIGGEKLARLVLTAYNKGRLPEGDTHTVLKAFAEQGDSLCSEILDARS